MGVKARVTEMHICKWDRTTVTHECAPASPEPPLSPVGSEAPSDRGWAQKPAISTFSNEDLATTSNYQFLLYYHLKIVSIMLKQHK
jgi:hypothetical protein